MTKITNLFEYHDAKEEKPIEMIKYLNDEDSVDCKNIKIGLIYAKASDYDNVCLLYRSRNHDVMMCWDDGGEPTITIGHWNDGVV